jgi:hypothetical protein
MKIVKLVISLLMATNLHAHIDENSEFYSDSGIRGPSFSEIKKQLAQLHTEYPNLTEIIPISESLGGRKNIGILFFNKEEGTANRLTVITGATHGNEYLNIADRLPRAMLEARSPGFLTYIANGGAILYVPIINPDGYERRNRRNNNRVDLNRDFPNSLIGLKGLTQPETSQYVAWVDNWIKTVPMQLDIVVDYHCCHGSLLYPFGYTSERIKRADLLRHVHVAELMQKYFPDYIHGITGEVLGYFPRGTTKDFWYLEYGAMGFTFEGKYRQEDKKLSEHVLWWNDVFSYLNQPLLPSEM